MKISSSCICRIVLVFVLSLSFAIPQNLLAQGQSVTAAELRDAVKQASSGRQKSLEQVRSFFGDPKISKILATAHIDANRIEKAVSTLSGAELEKLAARTAQIQSDFAAGALTNQQLTYIVIAVGAALLVLIVVAA
jgi:hypothetical protein